MRTATPAGRSNAALAKLIEPTNEAAPTDDVPTPRCTWMLSTALAEIAEVREVERRVLRLVDRHAVDRHVHARLRDAAQVDVRSSRLARPESEYCVTDGTCCEQERHLLAVVARLDFGSGDVALRNRRLDRRPHRRDGHALAEARERGQDEAQLERRGADVDLSSEVGIAALGDAQRARPRGQFNLEPAVGAGLGRDSTVVGRDERVGDRHTRRRARTRPRTGTGDCASAVAPAHASHTTVPAATSRMANRLHGVRSSSSRLLSTARVSPRG